MVGRMRNFRHVIAVVGGATAGAETASMLADRGATVVVFEQNARPYGKIEDGLPRWHVKLREKEYETVNQKLDRPDVHFVPSTRIGRDIDFHDLATAWGFNAVILAVGAWRDRPLPIEGADNYVGKGLIYQNPFIYWFNHFFEKDYDGPQYQVEDRGAVIGGGLASIDVIKVLQIEGARRTLEQRGIHVDMLHLEHAGIPAALAEHGLTWESLGLNGATLYYRRRIEDMPLADMPEDADAARRQKFEATRRRIVEKAMRKYLFQVQPLRAPVGFIVEGDRLVGLRFQHTEMKDGRLTSVDGAFDDVRAPLIISSIGSIPAPIAGVPHQGEVYKFIDPDLGQVAGYDAVFGAGNAVTGKGNIVASRKHGIRVGMHLIEHFLGVGEDDSDHTGEEAGLNMIQAPVDESVEKISAWVRARPALDAAQVEAILQRVRARQQAVGYSGTYSDWIARFTPATE
jgi:NADPH-dependent glutamate synthase beta subunit-like oxidoreductase